MAILSVNAGSSSLKFAVYPSQGKEILPVVLSGVFQGLEPSGRPNLKYNFNGQTQAAELIPGELDPFICALQELKALVLRLPGLPEMLLYLLEQGYSHDQLQDLLYKKSGLLGVSTLSADMRELRAHTNDLASKAISLFTHRIVRESGAMVACLEGLDVLAFSGGIGEHDAKLRSEVCNKMGWLGVKIDEGLNQSATGDRVTQISRPESAVEVWVIPTDEGMVSAREATKLLT